MSFDWDEYLNLASVWLDTTQTVANSTEEALYRSTISRSYYAVYHKALNYIGKKIGNPQTSGHHKLTEYLTKQKDGKYRTIGNQIKNLHQDRIAADYYSVFKGETPRNKAYKAFTQAKRISRSLNDLYEKKASE